MALKRKAFRAMGALVVLGLAGCAGSGVPDARSTSGRRPTVAEVPDADETVRGVAEPAVVTLDLGSRLRERRLAKGEELPGKIMVPATHLNGVPLTAALQAVLAGTDVSLSWASGSFEDRLVTVTNLSGPLPGVVEKICSSAKAFCAYRHGLLELKEKETFIVDLPSMPTKTGTGSAAANTMAEAIGVLAGDKVLLDQQGGNLVYTTDVEGQARVREYLDQLRHGRPLVVLQLYIWEVTLTRKNANGINWKNFKFSKIGNNLQNMVLSGETGLAALASPGVTLGAALSGQVDAEAVAEFLSEQGQVQTISNPQLTFISGSSADFRVGGKQRYISQVGQLNTSNVSGSNASSAGVGTNTVSTDSLDTGLTVAAGGVFEAGVVAATLEITLQDVISLNETPVQGLTINLPETSERKVSTTIRVRPGDNLVLAGLVTARDSNDRAGLPLPFGKRLPMYGQDDYKNSEMVVLVKPSVVLFADRDDAPDSAPASSAARLPDALVIDKDGTRRLAIPDGSAGPAPSVATAAPTGAPASMSSPAPDPPAPAVAAGKDPAPVGRRLMQRGFSHAFNQLLTPDAPTGTAKAESRP